MAIAKPWRVAGAMILATLTTVAPLQANSSKKLTNLQELETLSIEELPPWSIKFLHKGDNRHFKIIELMESFSLTRIQAVELQNQYRDILREESNRDKVKTFNLALDNVRKGVFESELDTTRLKKADFIVVFDLDLTIYDQTLKKPNECIDISYEKNNKKQKLIVFAPGWEDLFNTILELNGAIVLFTAYKDEGTYSNLSRWKWEGKSIYDPQSKGRKTHPSITGILSNSHLTRQSVLEGRGKTRRWSGSVILNSSKDLRILDSSLKKVIIIDDNPERIVHLRNLRLTKKFNGKRYCDSKKSAPAVHAAYKAELQRVQEEIIDSAKYMKKHKVDFRQAYLPYTQLGTLSVKWLESSLNKKDSIRAIRQDPSLVQRSWSWD